MADKRIIELANEKLVLADGDMTIVDSESGTYKYDLNRLAKKTITDTTLSVEGKPADAKAVGDALSSVDVDTVNNARQLLSENYVLDQEPYLFRASGGEGADRVEECLIGGSVGWNQLCDSASVTVTSGHKYISKVSGTWTVVASTGSAITGLTSGTDMVIDLTTMFGSTIADYISSLEQATAGAGVAFFRKYFPEDYYEYSAPTLKHVEGVSRKEVVGWNQWDEEWEVGKISTTTGGNITGTSAIRSKNYIPVIPNTVYCAHIGGAAWVAVIAYGYNKAIIQNLGGINNNFTFTTPSDCRYIRLYTSNTYGTTYNNDICINLSDPAKNGVYEPYHKNIYPLDSALMLRGIPKLTDGKLYFDGDIYPPSGQTRNRYALVDLGTLDWSAGTDATGQYFYSDGIASVAKTTTSASIAANIFCAKYTTTSSSSVGDDQIALSSGSTARIYVRDTSYSDVASFKASSDGVYLLYELKTPTTETATPYTSLQMLDPHGTEEFVSTGIVPVGHYSKYLENLRAKIEGLPKDFSTLIAPTEKEYKATQNYTVGSLLIVDNILYKVTSAIANGGTITPNTNCTATTLAAVIAALA